MAELAEGLSSSPCQHAKWAALAVGKAAGARGLRKNPGCHPRHHKILSQNTAPCQPRSSENGLSQNAYLPPSPSDTLFSEFSGNPSLPAQTAPSLPKDSGPSPSAPPLTTPVSVPSTVKTLGSLMGSQLLHLRQGELQMLCPQEAPRVLARLEAVRRTLGVRAPWGPDSQWKLGGSLGDHESTGWASQQAWPQGGTECDRYWAQAIHSPRGLTSRTQPCLETPN